MSDYWATHTVEQHEQALRELVKKGLSNDEMLIEIGKWFGENTPEFEANQILEKEVSQKISAKAKAKLSVESYFLLREKLRQQILNSAVEDAQKTVEEEARLTGSVCLKCGSHNIKSKGKEWECRDCGKRFRKH
jgi:transposase